MKKYYTAFLFNGYTPKELHCTHRYFGALNDIDLSHILLNVGVYLNMNLGNPHPEIPTVNFNTRQYFGPLESIPVLVPSEKVSLLPFLRETLSHIGQPDNYTYTPHVTTTMDQVYARFSHYALVDTNGEIIAKWELK